MPSSAGDGTPFEAFTATEPGRAPGPDHDVATEFRDGSQRARRETRRRRDPSTD
jgi:hypothetical protein